MVKGLEKFKDYFQEYKQYYVIIGGTACDVLMDEAGIGFRSTRDLDIVILVKENYSAFIEVFWDFVKAGQYGKQEKYKVNCNKYRFTNPSTLGFPDQLELFSLNTLGEERQETQHILPLITGEDVSDISAIILHPEYYKLIDEGKIEMNQLSILDAPYIIPLKARAWMDLKKRRQEGQNVDKNNVTKHLNDIIRLAQLLIPSKKILFADTVLKDMNDFITSFASLDVPGIQSIQSTFKDKSQVLELIRKVFL